MEKKRNDHRRVNWAILIHQPSLSPNNRPNAMLLSNSVHRSTVAVVVIIIKQQLIFQLWSLYTRH